MDRQMVSTVVLLAKAKKIRQRKDKRHEEIMREMRNLNAIDRKVQTRGRQEVFEVAFQIMEQDPEVDMVELAMTTGLDVQTLYRRRAQRLREQNMR